jgi:NIMA (never in mitosis gene a)-related kinase
MAQLVTDTRDGARYILKRTRLARQPERQREATIMEMFIQKETCHRNVVRCKESWMEKGFVACLLLEYCVGGELADLLSARRPKELLDEETVRVWFVQVASALAYLHSNNIIHRDVKAANIFMREDKSLALGDFGLSQTPSTSDELAHTILGTPQHMAPGEASQYQK